MRFAANLSLLFREHPLLDRFAAARDAGFDAVEVQFPYEAPAAQVARAREAAGVEVVLINAPVLQAHPAGFAGRPELGAEFQDALARAAEYADALGAGRLNVLSGCAGAGERTDCLDALVDNLMRADGALPGVEVVLELLNPTTVPGALVSDLETADEVLERCAGRVGLLFDIFHVAMLGLDPRSTLEARYGRVRHVQFADAPGRNEPGTGQAAIEPTLSMLHARGYNGWVSAEYHPSGATVDSLVWLAPWRERFAA